MSKENQPTVHVVGGGLAGSEAAWQCLKLGLKVIMHEMRPVKMTAAHNTGNLAELVCSNSFKSMSEASASGELKLEMKGLDSIIVTAGEACSVPAGQALAVDREVFSALVEKRLLDTGSFERRNEEITEIPSEDELLSRNEAWIIATGPLTSEPLTAEIQRLCGADDRMFFYDAIAPILAADSIDMSRLFWGSRYESSEDGDYLNIPLTHYEYENFISDVEAAEKTPLHDFEKTQYFEACLPIEVMVERGRDTPRFGPMKPVGFLDPRTGRQPWALIQLRKENKGATMLSMVGFQTKMKWPEQKRVFSKLPGLENVEFFRYGSVHRNTYINGPKVLAADLSLRSVPHVFLAGQLTGVEGYTESAAIGLVAARAASAKLLGKEFRMPPVNTVLGSLARYVTEGPLGDYSPMNANLGLLPPIPKTKVFRKADRKAAQCKVARDAMTIYLQDIQRLMT